MRDNSRSAGQLEGPVAHIFLSKKLPVEAQDSLWIIHMCLAAKEERRLLDQITPAARTTLSKTQYQRQ